MKANFSDPNKIAASLALIVSLFSGCLLILLNYLTDLLIPLWHILAVILLIFIFSHFIIEYFVNRYISEKIRIIYKTIRTSKTTKGIDKTPVTASLEKINQEVAEWSEIKKREIEELKQMAVYRREFLGNVSHELKTPIFNIQGYVLTLLDGGLDDPTINKEYLLRTEKSINRMISLVEDLEKISQLESGELQLRYSKFDIIALTKDVVEFLEIKLKKKNANVTIIDNWGKPLMVEGDLEHIREVLINLIDNSIKYGSAKQGKTEISYYSMDGNILVEVTDNGPGIESHELPRIFERFYRVDKARSREQGGSGLGLAIVKHIIEAHNETINVRSTPGIGTTFSFTLRKA